MGSKETGFPRWFWIMLIALMGAAGGIIGFSITFNSWYSAEDGITLFDTGNAIALVLVSLVLLMYAIGIFVFKSRTVVKS